MTFDLRGLCDQPGCVLCEARVEAEWGIARVEREAGRRAAEQRRGRDVNIAVVVAVSVIVAVTCGAAWCSANEGGPEQLEPAIQGVEHG